MAKEKYLIIVESPAKTKTLKKFLGNEYEVVASMGHIKDLPKTKLGVNTKTFKAEHVILKNKIKVLSAIKKAAQSASIIYLAPDPDREGEAIAWHIADELHGFKGQIHRVMFNEITRQAVIGAIKNYGILNKNMYESYLARRILDRLVGYQISPILWEKIRRGLSAGRVQSVTVKLICDREKERQAFVSQEYWTIAAVFITKTGDTFEARLFKVNNENINIPGKEQADSLVKELTSQRFAVIDVEVKERKSYPLPPFITSTMQQEAIKRLRFTADRTMRVAQKLYEGIDLGQDGATALITYMRTDSVRIADEALAAVRGHIAAAYGSEYLPPGAMIYKNKKTAQDAHEAIRPAHFDLPPEKIKKYLSSQEYDLYRLIWNRFVASQMQPAVFKQLSVLINAGRFLLKATGATLIFDGHHKVYNEEREDSLLPEIKKNDELKLKHIKPEQHFTEPPPRYTEASLVKELEEKGIGRPSTYATILSTIQKREYVVKEDAKFLPTELGTLVTDMLEKNFPQIMDIGFTANMEEELDKIEEGTETYINLLKTFYDTFQKTLSNADKKMKNMKKIEEKTDILCEKCGAQMVIKWGKNGMFLACSNYPECKNTKNFKKDQNGKIIIVEEEKSSEKCELCGSPMFIKRTKTGVRFIACSNYPQCKNTKPFPIGVKCPACGAEVVERSTKSGRIFYGCSGYPKCNFISWNRPVNEACPKCGSNYLIEKYNKKEGRILTCPNKNCDYTKKIE